MHSASCKVGMNNYYDYYYYYFIMVRMITALLLVTAPPPLRSLTPSGARAQVAKERRRPPCTLRLAGCAMWSWHAAL